MYNNWNAPLVGPKKFSNFFFWGQPPAVRPGILGPASRPWRRSNAAKPETGRKSAAKGTYRSPRGDWRFGGYPASGRGIYMLFGEKNLPTSK
jgi:hypothetical protein